MKTKCEVCKKHFDAIIKKEMLDADIQEIYYECPRCRERYHISYTNTEMRSYYNLLQEMRADLMKNKNNKKLFNEVQMMMRTYKEMSDTLNNKSERMIRHG